MTHDLFCEERQFSLDIEALCQHDKGFDQAWKNGTEYKLEIKLPVLFELCPRSYQRTLMYARFVNFLAQKKISLKIKSRKNNNNNDGNN